MEREQAVEVIREACVVMAQQMMRISPAIRHLDDPAVRDRLFETMYQLTTNVETIKKQLGKLGGTDDSALL